MTLSVLKVEVIGPGKAVMECEEAGGNNTKNVGIKVSFEQ
jgi:hypothetical protein